MRAQKREAWKQAEDKAIQFPRQRVRRINEITIKRGRYGQPGGLLIGSSGRALSRNRGKIRAK